MALLRYILAIVFPPRATELVVRKTDYGEIHKVFSVQKITTPITMLSPDAFPIFTLLPYRLPLVKAFIIEAKFHGNKTAQESLGRIVGDYLTSLLLETAVLIPLPLGKKRLRERGYNQVEEVAKCALRYCSVFSNPPLQASIQSNTLVRTRETLPQTTLARRDRLQNMQGAFIVTSVLDPDTTYIMLDDVLTTGATLSAAHDALIQAGAQKVIAIALAH
jgi:ComF family protein